MSSWGNKLEAKLDTLVEASSNETLQTLAKWIAFNRKRAKDFFPVLLTRLRANVTMQPVLLGVLHEVLLAEQQNTAKWDKLEELRVAIGEQVLLVVLKDLGTAAVGKLQGEMLPKWDDVNAFGGPTLLNQIKKALAAMNTSNTAIPTESSKSPEKASPAPKVDASSPPPTVASPEKKPLPPPPPSRQQSDLVAKTPEKASRKPPKSQKHDAPSPYDFDKHDIPYAPVEPHAMLEPSRAIATLQIARDMRNDEAVQLSSLMSAMPQDIRAACAKAADGPYTMDAATARDYSSRIDGALLDMDMDEQLQNAKTFRNIIERQSRAREQLVELLVRSRCKFGADEAAKAFYEADSVKPELMRRKQILADAMELEGFDVVEVAEDSNKKAKKTVELPPLKWYKSQEGTDSSKRQRVE